MGTAPGAVVLRSDVIRKRLHGVSPETRLGSDAYRPEVSARVYADLCARAATVLAAGYSVIADAVFADPAAREAIEQVARQSGAPFTGVWLEAPAEVLRARVSARSQDASDATAAVVERQLRNAPHAHAWQVVDTGGGAGEAERRVRESLATKTTKNTKAF